MSFDMSNFGINTVHIKVEDLDKFSIQRFESCLGRNDSHEVMNRRVLNELKYGAEKGFKRSVHLPIFMFDWYKEDYLSAFYLDQDKDKRELSFRLLEENLKACMGLEIPYGVLHFPGVYRDEHSYEGFEDILNQALDRVNDLAKKYDMKILFEYFGSNCQFFGPENWIERLSKYDYLGLLTDTGHLYYASLMRGFDYMDALKKLAQVSEAFHLWTTKGKEFYSNSDYYKKYHHIMCRPGQRLEDGWAFDSDEVLRIIAKENRPIIVEASPIYKGREYYESGIVDLMDFLSNI